MIDPAVPVRFQYSPSHEGALLEPGNMYQDSHFNTPPLTRGLTIDGKRYYLQEISILPLSRGGSPVGYRYLIGI